MYSKKQIEELRKEYPKISDEYLEYLSEIGAGSFGREFCTIFGDLCELDEFYDESLLEFLDFEERVLQFGCDPSNKALVFLIDEDWKVGEIWDDDLGSIDKTGKTFYLDFNLQICQRCCINNTFGIFRILSNIEFHNIININKLI
ncbi:hypothetical protein B0P06_003974 [Clostridium saccharoperbutylacetonicum]|uniref:Knr4/Smi1-like domain-containing protein n=1 Tax=Clostridium saccharoperbutylacetonicum N1-4(HMT) TaxID=931276 RepID=M1MSN5_9CLOT|nr:hypothetical protein [Clostridium saccharoperbutylacetonicum]AGF57721.1 hypothetical protein Cspa_c39640 [Clostridium saccharoperbutylacetonicum N1-4(HMT)]NRT61511.1 hypothetical protein [Clostridium saccharoperbutylacetonicum]NSB24833.1 hypothetical protein [Clostridium saccharoperbutylacetonicum]NSB44203.1 hypothetical protein [Clostridium saccharoperbutylacetonicum]